MRPKPGSSPARCQQGSTSPASRGRYRVLDVCDGNAIGLGRHSVRVLETPQVHHWDSMMLVEETTGSLFPSDLFLQPGDQPPIVGENLGDEMCAYYRRAG